MDENFEKWSDLPPAQVDVLRRQTLRDALEPPSVGEPGESQAPGTLHASENTAISVTAAGMIAVRRGLLQ